MHLGASLQRVPAASTCGRARAISDLSYLPVLPPASHESPTAALTHTFVSAVTLAVARVTQSWCATRRWSGLGIRHGDAPYMSGLCNCLISRLPRKPELE